MSYTLQQLNYSVPFTGAEYVDTSKLTPLFPQPTPVPESDALGQWEFGPDSSSLIDLVNGRTLTPLSAGNPPTYGTNYLKPVAGGLYGLVSDIADAGGPWTHWAVVQYKAAGGYLFGTADGTAANGGAALWINPTNGQLVSTVRGFSSGIAKVPTGVSDGDWIFVALAMSDTGLLIYIGNSDVVPVTGTYIAPTTTKYHGVGDCYHAGSNFYSATIEHASHGIHATAKSQSDLDGIYSRVKARMSDRGVAVL